MPASVSMAFTIVRSVATKITSSLTGAAESPALPGGTPAAQPDSVVAVNIGPRKRSTCGVMTRVYAAVEGNTASALVPADDVTNCGASSQPHPSGIVGPIVRFLHQMTQRSTYA